MHGVGRKRLVGNYELVGIVETDENVQKIVRSLASTKKLLFSDWAQAFEELLSDRMYLISSPLTWYTNQVPIARFTQSTIFLKDNDENATGSSPVMEAAGMSSSRDIK